MSSVKKVFLGSIATETNTFSPLRTDLQDFKDSFYASPGQHPKTPTLCSAIYPVARTCAHKYGWQLIEGTASWAEPGGIINQSSWNFLRDQFLSELKAALPVDIVLLGLHGAMVAQNCLDCEGELIEAARTIVGPDTIIGATFDPHSHLSAKRVKHADIIVAFKEFPHTDFVETAENLVSLVHKMSTNQIRPEISTFDCRMIELFPTSRQPMRGFIDRIRELEGTQDVLSISIIHGFMAGDVPDLGTHVIVISNGKRKSGDDIAKKLGMELFSFRGRTRPEFLSPDDAIERAQTSKKAPVVIADVWDNPGGGVPGDGTIILRKLLDQGVQNAALAAIWDPVAVRTCFSAGEGAILNLRFGAKMSPNSGEPIDAKVTVRRIVRNAFQSFRDSIVPLGDSVWIDVGKLSVILSSVRSQVFNPDIFTNFGIQPLEKSILVVKSTNHFYDAFSHISNEILYAAVEGTYPSDPKNTNYKHLKRPIWPRMGTPHDHKFS